LHGLVCLLPSPLYGEVEGVWYELEEHCGLNGIRVTPYPHFSWCIAQGYEEAELKRIVEEIARSAEPFEVWTAGIGIFTGVKPVIYIPVVKTRQLVGLHETIWKATGEALTGMAGHYGPGCYMPHISLAYEDVDEARLKCAMQRLAFRDFSRKFEVNNISFIYEPEGQTGELKFSVYFNR